MVVFLVSVSIINVFCNGGFNGMVNVIVIGGIVFYSYLWFLMGGINVIVIGLSVGIYIVIVIDNNGCIIIVFGLVI